MWEKQVPYVRLIATKFENPCSNCLKALSLDHVIKLDSLILTKNFSFC